MWRVLLLVGLWNGLNAWQTDTPPVMDEEMKSLMEQVEGVEENGSEEPDKSVEEPHGMTFETDEERALYQRAADYLAACAASEWQTAYGFFWEPYREAVSLSSYFKQEKGAVESFQITQVGILSDECGYVRANYGIQNSMMDLKKIPARQKWHFEKGDWHLIADPYSNIMGLRTPGSKKLEIPCSFPRTRPAKESKKQEATEKKEL